MRDRQATRRRIHDAALELFVSQGVTETSVRDLAQKAGIAEGTLYRHYASKDDLVADLFASNYAAFARRLTELDRPPQPLRQRLSTVVTEIFGFHDAQPTLFRFLLLVQHQALPRMVDGQGNPVTVIRQMIEQGRARGEIPAIDPALATAMVLGLILQPATALVYGALAAPLSSYAPAIATACWRVLSTTETENG
ncbi:MAG: TetR/AcrR family transcriptional regulator [Magnetospirillum gryphiswaldense]|nr:TetR/AcrR family transcriptional regulator [Magnetospirillum gryphiswaldense]